MSTSEVDERPPLPHRLVVPTVDTGEVGLVLTVCGVEWERAPTPSAGATSGATGP